MSLIQYPFKPLRVQVRQGLHLSCIDVGPRNAPVVLMLHGNPSWSYYWRHLITALSPLYRCIVPDHMGMGYSDKPSDSEYCYTLQSRIEDLTILLKELDVHTPVTLIVHDWGGMIGFGWACANQASVARLVITNTAGFLLPHKARLPWYIHLGRAHVMGELVVRGLNAFALGAAWCGVERPMPTEVRRAYCAPYDSWAHRIAIIRFMQDIPLHPNDLAWAIVVAVEQQLPQLANKPTLIAWGLQDAVFTETFFVQFQKIFSNAKILRYPDAGHYVLEDKSETLSQEVLDFLRNTQDALLD